MKFFIGKWSKCYLHLDGGEKDVNLWKCMSKWMTWTFWWYFFQLGWSRMQKSYSGNGFGVANGKCRKGPVKKSTIFVEILIKTVVIIMFVSMLSNSKGSRNIPISSWFLKLEWKKVHRKTSCYRFSTPLVPKTSHNCLLKRVHAVFFQGLKSVPPPHAL